MFQKIIEPLLVTSLLSLGAAGAAQAADDPPPATAHCVQLPRIDRTEAVGDHNILFHMRDGAIYQNELPHSCPGLKADKPFMYRVVLNQLCDSDVITILERWPFGFTPAESCVLGEFNKIDEADADALRAAAKR